MYTTPTNNRIDAAIQEAVDYVERRALFERALVAARTAFWHTLTNHYPQCEGEDMQPEVIARFNLASESAAEEWLQKNITGELVAHA